MLAHVLHRAHGFADAAFRAFRRRLSTALRPAATNSLVLGTATDLLRSKPSLPIGEIVRRDRVAGLIHAYEREAG